MHTTHLTADHHGNRRILQWIAAIRFPVLRAEQDSVDMRTAAGQRGHAPERSVSLIHLQRSVTEAHRIECSQSEIVADESRKPIERVPVHRRHGCARGH